MTFAATNHPARPKWPEKTANLGACSMTHLRSAILSVVLPVLAVGSAAAQHDHAPVAPMPAASPYAGLEHRPVKALSEQQIADLKAGRGMGLALPAELNGYPGPAHVLELADALRLSVEQRAQTKALFEAMKAEAIPIGERIISDETTLDHLFAERTVTQAALDAAVSRIASAQGDLRAAHLRYHLAMMEVLTLAQIAHYGELRGYEAGRQHRH
jgi:Spy/CpxP family protein refolding chaperone